MASARRRRLFLLALALLGLWTAFATTIELYRSVWLWRHDPWTAAEPSRWRITSRHATALFELTSVVDHDLSTPRGAWVDVDAAALPASERLFYWLWLRYSLPAHRLRLADPGSAGQPPAGYRISARPQPGDRRHRPLAETSAGAVYRLKP